MIITVSRQFGSGGREVGKRLADALGLTYYDKELVTEISNHTDLNESYVSSVLESGGFRNYAFTFGRTMPFVSTTPAPVTDVLVAQQKIIKAIGEKGNCVIVGRSADVILKDFKPFRLFIYADNDSKIARCRARAPEGEHYTDKQMIRRFKEIDSGRRKLHDLLGVHPWGDKAGYDLMINTTNVNIKAIIPALAEYIKNSTK
ncbi:MAG TPA: cytidylate kinase-like family protein [Candidatus Coproplasma avicola]|uniref:Cytidylate kinase-like family protein n=1 Tax=Candidatus Coproplasma avicola TaxID=2840744 RepID=A0A9D1J8D7_9FIRM|nr:cytidylate kinase-like family protein [Candidatus Coproplasma avicola]